MMNSDLVQDSKVVGSAVFACILDYTQICNQIITLAISICTLIYVAARAAQTIKQLNKKHHRRKHQ